MSKDVIIERTTAATYTASGGAIVFGLSANEFAAYCGIAIAALTFIVNMWFKWQHLRIQKQLAVERPDCATCPEREKDDDD